jgi:hypothetical protein
MGMNEIRAGDLSSLGPRSPESPRPPWIYRHWKWFIPVFIVGGIAGFVFVLFSAIEYSFRASDAYNFALKKAAVSPEVAARVGSPFQVAWFVAGHINLNNSDGEAALSIPISGPRGRGKIVVKGKKHAGRWTYQTLEVDVSGEAEPIPLLGPPVENPSPLPTKSI